MKFSLTLALAATLLLGGCSVFRRSPAWEAVMQTPHTGAEDGKEGYLNDLHRSLSSAGVEHKLVSYQFHYRNVYGEESVGAAVAIIYRDETTPSNPWWIMDESHHTPVWLPNWDLKAELEFFTRHTCEVVSVKDYAASERDPKTAQAPRHLATTLARAQQGRRQRALFAGSLPRLRVAPAKHHETAVADDSLFARLFSSRSASTDEQAQDLFRRTHGTSFDPGSRVDREKLDALRRQLLSRRQIVQLRTE